jgi:hypothetical protein
MSGCTGGAAATLGGDEGTDGRLGTGLGSGGAGASGTALGVAGGMVALGSPAI